MISYGEDIELYVSSKVKSAAKKPKVLIILDNSGSMRTEESVKDDYDPSITYEAVGGLSAFSDKFVYFTKGGVDGAALPTPDSPSEARRFLDAINNCTTAREILAKKGFYTGHLREFVMKGNSGSWNEIPDNNGANVEVVDCEDDVNLVPESLDPAADSTINVGIDPMTKAPFSASKRVGYPVNGKGDKKDPIYFGSRADSQATVSWEGEMVTLYTDNYLRWHHNADIDKSLVSRLDIAKKAISDVIDAIPAVEFGLEVFNYNDGDADKNSNGGRIIFDVKDMNATNRASILDIINNKIDPETWTPLCESVFEAQQYFGGKAVDFGNDDKNRSGYTGNTPPSIKDSGNYSSPFTECVGKGHVILITDGEPTYDNGADSRITSLSSMEPKIVDGEVVLDSDGKPVLEKVNFSGTAYTKDGYNNYLPALARWMYTSDINPTLEGKQTLVTHTIGFSDGAAKAVDMLKETAKQSTDAQGKQEGKFFYTENGPQLTNALLGAISSMTSRNDTLTSASVAANNFDRTETLNSVYYAMFDPQNGPRWQGNLKKYKVIGGKQIGSNGVPAINESTGHFSTNVKSYWSSSVDGNKVSTGGVVDWYATATSRTLLTDTAGKGNELADFNRTNLEAADPNLATTLGVDGAADESAEIDAMLNWAKGLDVDDEDNDKSTSDYRADTFGDPLHSKPLVINYGDSHGIRIIIGTNSGALHMFEDGGETVKENWAFMPQEFLSNIDALRSNSPGAPKVYGIDGQITSYLYDKSGDGVIQSADGDKAWIFFGLRRGGSSYYALDVSTPNKPSLMWKIDSDSPGFSELGQSWSQPKIGYSKINIVSDVALPVLFFGGGYDTTKDGVDLAAPDTKGRAIYMVDAASGDLKWSMAPSGGTTAFSGTDSIPSSIATLDSDADGMVDRLYTGDTGGNVWRIDMPGNAPTGSNKWTVFKLAELGSDVSNALDNRFFNEATIVRTFIKETIETDVVDEFGTVKKDKRTQEIPYDAILIGSGDRSNPLGTDTDDTMYMLKDKYIQTQTFTAFTTPAIPTAITKADLYNYTDNPFDKVTKGTEAYSQLSYDVSLKSGWYVDFTQSGEKSSSSAIVINGVAYFTSFTPPDPTAPLVGCRPPTGSGWLYAIDLALGIDIYNWTAEGRTDGQGRIDYISEQFLGSPTLIVVPDDPSDPDDKAKGNIIVGRKIIPVGFNLSTLRTFLYTDEDQ